MKENIKLEKSFGFALSMIGLYQVLQRHHGMVLSKQLLRSGTSIGANVEESSAAQSKKDFMQRCRSLQKKPENHGVGLGSCRGADLSKWTIQFIWRRFPGSTELLLPS